jgi:hypothetical protein
LIAFGEGGSVPNCFCHKIILLGGDPILLEGR